MSAGVTAGIIQEIFRGRLVIQWLLHPPEEAVWASGLPYCGSLILNDLEHARPNMWGVVSPTPQPRWGFYSPICWSSSRFGSHWYTGLDEVNRGRPGGAGCGDLVHDGRGNRTIGRCSTDGAPSASTGFTCICADSPSCNPVRTSAVSGRKSWWCQTAGRRIECADAWIAAAALLYQAPLVTHNADSHDQ